MAKAALNKKDTAQSELERFQNKLKQQEKLLSQSLKEGNDIDREKYLLVKGYIHEFEAENKHIMIPNEILIVILLFYLEQYKIVSFEKNYKSSKIILSDNGTCAGKDAFGNYYLLGDHEPVTQGISVWRVNV